MNYRSISDLSRTIRNNLYKMPPDVDLVVGIPRSGMLAASIIAQHLNLKFCDLDNFINDVPLKHGRVRKPRYLCLERPSQARHALVVDDSIASGRSMNEAREKLHHIWNRSRLTFCAVYASSPSIESIDFYFEIVEGNRFFEWNVMHTPSLSEVCLDIDGVLCVDPTQEQNDDGLAYMEFLTNAKPLVLPSCPVGHLVTCRLEKYRTETERWLAKHGVEYAELHMLDLPDAETRRKLECHAAFKSQVYKKQYRTRLFIESNSRQALEITKISGKPTICFSTQEFFRPDFSYALAEYQSKRFIRRAAGKIFRIAKNLLNHD